MFVLVCRRLVSTVFRDPHHPFFLILARELRTSAASLCLFLPLQGQTNRAPIEPTPRTPDQHDHRNAFHLSVLSPILTGTVATAGSGTAMSAAASAAAGMPPSRASPQLRELIERLEKQLHDQSVG